MRYSFRARRGFWFALIAVVVSALGAWTDARACTYLIEEQYEGELGVWNYAGTVIATGASGACPAIADKWSSNSDMSDLTCQANGVAELGPVFAGGFTFFSEHYDWRMTPQSGADCAIVQAGAGEPEPVAVMTPADALEASWLVVIAWASVFAVRFIGTALAGWRDVGGE